MFNSTLTFSDAFLANVLQRCVDAAEEGATIDSIRTFLDEDRETHERVTNIIVGQRHVDRAAAVAARAFKASWAAEADQAELTRRTERAFGC